MFRGISHLCKVSSVFNSEELCKFVITEQSGYLAITRHILQKDINLLLTKTIAARSPQKTLMTSTVHVRLLLLFANEYNVRRLSSSLNNKFLDFTEQNINIVSRIQTILHAFVRDFKTLLPLFLLSLHYCII